MNNLRHRLDEFKDITHHRRDVEALRAEYSHTIDWVETGDAGSDCLAYALGIPSQLLNLVGAFKCILKQFFDSVLLELLIEIQESEVTDGSLIFYFSSGELTHAGKRTADGQVISKWGKNPVYKHDRLEVPAKYGDKIRFYQRPSERFITRKFIDFVRSHPRYIDLKEPFEESVTDCGC